MGQTLFWVVEKCTYCTTIVQPLSYPKAKAKGKNSFKAIDV